MLITRLVTALILGSALTVSVLWLPTPATAAILGAMWLAGAWEWAGLAGCGRGGRGAYVAVLAAAMLAGFLMPWPARSVDAFVVAGLVCWAGALIAILTYPRRFSQRLILGVGCIALLPGWWLLVRIHGTAPQGAGLALTGLALVWAADIGAYVVGRAVGRVKLAPRVSPGKTWEGVAGGVGAAVLVALAAALLLGLEPVWLAGLAVLTALVSVVGDLSVSMLKRNAGVKDSSHLLPGHGGVLDRIDGLIAAVPLFALGLLLAGLVD